VKGLNRNCVTNAENTHPRFKRGRAKAGFRDGRSISEISSIADELENVFKNLSGYRTEIGKPFTFRIWTKAEFDNIVKPNGYKLFE
jgi:hypothetical protein